MELEQLVEYTTRQRDEINKWISLGLDHSVIQDPDMSYREMCNARILHQYNLPYEPGLSSEEIALILQNGYVDRSFISTNPLVHRHNIKDKEFNSELDVLRYLNTDRKYDMDYYRQYMIEHTGSDRLLNRGLFTTQRVIYCVDNDLGHLLIHKDNDGMMYEGHEYEDYRIENLNADIVKFISLKYPDLPRIKQLYKSLEDELYKNYYHGTVDGQQVYEIVNTLIEDEFEETGRLDIVFDGRYDISQRVKLFDLYKETGIDVRLIKDTKIWDITYDTIISLPKEELVELRKMSNLFREERLKEKELAQSC